MRAREGKMDERERKHESRHMEGRRVLSCFQVPQHAFCGSSKREGALEAS